MNVCIVSTFEGTTEDYMEMFNATKESALKALCKNMS